jgi:hypothetical protein
MEQYKSNDLFHFISSFQKGDVVSAAAIWAVREKKDAKLSATHQQIIYPVLIANQKRFQRCYQTERSTSQEGE